MVAISVLLSLILLVWLLFYPIPQTRVPLVERRAENRRGGRVVRRRGAEWAVDLSRRRAWFADGDDDPGDDDTRPFDVSQLPAEAQAYIQRLEKNLAETQHESIGRRKYIEKVDPELEALRKTQENWLKEQGKYKELYEKAQSDLAQTRLRAERADVYEQQIKASNEAKLSLIPDDYKPMVDPLVESLSPEQLSVWLDTNMSRFTTPKAPDIGAGTSTGNGKVITLTAEQEDARNAAGMTKEEYIEFAKKAGQLK